MGGNNFEPRLESLRGIAALIVAAHHGMSAFSGQVSDHSSLFGALVGWLLWITNPGASVMFFFVLSGYVLGLALERSREFVPYVIRRAFRILPIFILSVLFAYACVTMVRIEPPPSGVTEFFQRTFWPMPEAAQLIGNLTFQSSSINGPSWSIYPEIIGSLFLPVLVFAHSSVAPRWKWGIFAVCAAALAFSDYRLVLWFYCGFFLPGEMAKLMTKPLIRLAAFVVGYLIIRYVGEYAEYFKFKTIAPSAIGASMMIASVISSQSFMAWLSIAPLRFIGRVSYSFYLLHWPFFYLCWFAYMQTSFQQGFVGNFLVCILSIAAALAVSAATYALIELPAMKLGLRVSRWRPAAAKSSVVTTTD